VKKPCKDRGFFFSTGPRQKPYALKPVKNGVKSTHDRTTFFAAFPRAPYFTAAGTVFPLRVLFVFGFSARRVPPAGVVAVILPAAWPCRSRSTAPLELRADVTNRVTLDTKLSGSVDNLSEAQAQTAS
jgi:hypothetical protein